MNSPEGPRQSRRFGGGRVVLAGFLLVVAITAYVLLRIVQTSEPGPPPADVPERPAATSSS